MSNKIRKTYRLSEDLLLGIQEWQKQNTGSATSFVETSIDEKLKRDLGKSWRNKVK